MARSTRGRIVILSGPSGVGKTSVLRALMRSCPLPLVASVSATTRPPRQGERDGVDYHFLDADRFQALRAADGFLEYCEVFGQGHWYGTLKSEVLPRLEAGQWVILEIDVQGAMTVARDRADAITIFLRPASWESLESRLRGRGTESEETVRQRLAVAKRELAAADRYQHQVVNDSLHDAVEAICKILVAEYQRP